MVEDRGHLGDERREATEARPSTRGAICRRAFLRKLGKIALGGAFVGASGFFYSYDLETRWIDLTRIPMPLRRLSHSFEGYRVMHISDLHLDDRTEPGYLEKIVRLVNEQEPDLIAFTGDFVTFTPERFVPALAATLSRLEVHDGVFAVLGNHDHLTGPDVVSRAIREGGVTELCNEVRTMKRAGYPLHVCGLDDGWKGNPRLDHVLSCLPGTGPTILLVHEPDFADTVSTSGRFDLQLSRHSHGDQIRFPLVGAGASAVRPEVPGRGIPCRRHAPVHEPGPPYSPPTFPLSLLAGDYHVRSDLGATPEHIPRIISCGGRIAKGRDA